MLQKMKIKEHKLTPAIVIPAYNRPEAFKRLLNGINNSKYPSDSVELIISTEFGASPNVLEIAETFQFKHGKKSLIKRNDRLGVKEHIIACADLSEKYGSVLVLEDDLMVSPDFYFYAADALTFYQRENSVAGISLYSQRFNETAQLPFEPMPGEYSVYFMQLACSWGQAWTADQWVRFKKWLALFKNSETNGLPENIKKWGSDSWKKIFNIYMLQTDTYFTYPYRSFTTNYSEQDGTHIKNKGGLFQVPIGAFNNGSPVFNFPLFMDQTIRYDMFMECNSELVAFLSGIKQESICVDLYGTKPMDELLKYNFVISPRKGPKPIRSYPLNLKPPELNLQFTECNHKKPFFNLYRREQIAELKPLTRRQYSEMAAYFSYYKIFSRRFTVGFLITVLSKMLQKK